jgi:hypothetical protein
MDNTVTATTNAVRGVLPNSQRSKEVVQFHAWDRRVWDKVRHTEVIDGMVRDLYTGDKHRGGDREALDEAGELVRSVFGLLYKANTKLTPKRSLDRNLHAVRRIAEELQNSPALEQLHEHTFADELMTTMALKSMQPVLHEILSRVPDPPPEPEEGQGEQGDQDGQPQPGEGQAEAATGEQGEGEAEGQGEGQTDDQEGTDGQPGDQDGEGEGQPQDDGDWDLDAEAEAAEAAWEEAFDQLLDDADIDREIYQGVTQASQEATDLTNARLGIGCEDGEWKSMPSEERMELANRLMTEETQIISKMIGRVMRYALGLRAQRITNVPIHPYDIEFGDDILRALPEQFVWLSNPNTKVYFYYLWGTKRLRMFKRRGETEVGQGPLEVCIDKSSSMKVKKMGWAMGVAEALRRYAADDGRDYHAMFFGTNNQRDHFDFPQGKGTWRQVLDFMGVVADGGTHFDGVLDEALQRASTHYDEAGETKADIVFITDGQAALSDAWINAFNKERGRIGVRVFSVYIGGAADMAGKTGPVGLLNRISDVVISVSELRPLEAKAIFEGIA